jgi:hypothetical protein
MRAGLSSMWISARSCGGEDDRDWFDSVPRQERDRVAGKIEPRLQLVDPIIEVARSDLGEARQGRWLGPLEPFTSRAAILRRGGDPELTCELKHELDLALEAEWHLQRLHRQIWCELNGLVQPAAAEDGEGSKLDRRHGPTIATDCALTVRPRASLVALLAPER